MKRFLVAFFCFVLAVGSVAEGGYARPHHNFFKRHHTKLHHVRHKKRIRKPALPPIVVANIDVSSQTMSVSVNGWPTGYWAVSTARVGYHTPRGAFRVQRMARVYYSKKYDNSPMPNSVFFTGGVAIHGTYHLRQLGRPASHGCVRLAPDNAARLYDLVQEYGANRTRIIVTD